MADRKITDLTALAAGSQATGDLVTIVDVSESAAADKNKKMTMENLFKGIPGDVGIGVSAPDGTLHVHSGTAGSVTANGNADNLIVEHNGTGGISILTPDANHGYLMFGSPTSNEGAILRYRDSDNIFAIGTEDAAGELQFRTGAGSEALRIDSSGNCGIGTSSPSELLHTVKASGTSRVRFEASASHSFARLVAGSTSYNSGVEFFSGTTNTANITAQGGGELVVEANGSERMRIDSSGQVGIGTSSPSAPLTVFGGSASSPTIRIEGGSSGTDNARIESEYNLVLACNGDGDQSDRKIQFRNNATDLVAIDSSGNVGIGTTTPGSVTGSGIDLERSGPATLRLNDTSGNGAVVEIFADDGNMSAVYDSRGHSSNHGHQFRVNGSEKARIDSSGRLLVGTTSSVNNAKIQVIGDSAATTNPGLVRIGTSSAANTFTSPTQLARLEFGPGDNVSAASIQAWYDVTATGSTSDFPGRLTFSTTADGASGPTERMRISEDGRISTENGGYFSGTNNGDAPFSNAPIVLQNTSNNTNATVIQFKGHDGSLTGSVSTRVNVTTYSTSSDYRLKENVVAIADGITRVKQLAPKRFNFIGYDDTICDGFLAHEAQAVVPEAVVGTHNEVDDDGNAVMQGIDQSKLVPLLTAALKEAIAKIETLETKVAALEAQ